MVKGSLGIQRYEISPFRVKGLLSDTRNFEVYKAIRDYPSYHSLLIYHNEKLDFDFVLLYAFCGIIAQTSRCSNH